MDILIQIQVESCSSETYEKFFKMKLFLLVLTITVLTVKIIKAAPLMKSEAIGLEFEISLTENPDIGTEDEREGRSSPVGSIGGYITSYQEKKRRKQHKKPNHKSPVFYKKTHEQFVTKKPVFFSKPARGSYYEKNHKHCFYGHIFVRC